MGTDAEMLTYHVYHNGECIGEFSKDAGMVDFTMPAEYGTNPDFGWKPFEIKSIIPKEWKCHSRKRFVKLLMKHGYDCRGANGMADEVKAAGGNISYQDAVFWAVYLWNRIGGENGTD